MAEEVLQSVAVDLAKINEQIDKARYLISAAKDAGEDTLQMEAKLKDLETKRTKWERVLTSRGIEIPK